MQAGVFERDRGEISERLQQPFLLRREPERPAVVVEENDTDHASLRNQRGAAERSQAELAQIAARDGALGAGVFGQQRHATPDRLVRQADVHDRLSNGLDRLRIDLMGGDSLHGVRRRVVGEDG